MGEDQSSTTLHDYVADMALLEGQIEAALDRRRSEVSDHPEAADAVERFHAMAKSQKEAMETRLQTIGGAESNFNGTIAAIPLDTAGNVRREAAPRHVATVLHEIYTSFTHAVLGYAMLHAVAHRLYDLATAEDLATQHMKSYAGAAQEIHQLIGDVVSWELSKDGRSVSVYATSVAWVCAYARLTVQTSYSRPGVMNRDPLPGRVDCYCRRREPVAPPPARVFAMGTSSLPPTARKFDLGGSCTPGLPNTNPGKRSCCEFAAALMNRWMSPLCAWKIHRRGSNG